MFKKKGNLLLFLLLAIMLGAYFFISMQDKKKGERNFKGEVVDISEDKATKVVIYPGKTPDAPVELTRDGDAWQVKLNENKKVTAVQNVVENTFNEIQSIKPNRLASKSEDKWAEYKVDDQGTRVEVYEGNKKQLDIIIGKFDLDPRSLQQNSQYGEKTNPKFTSYVRLAGEKEVFAVSGFYEGLNSQTVDAYRDKQMLKLEKANIQNINFNYPDSAFKLVLANDKWLAGGRAADSSKVVSYLTALSTLTGTKFLPAPSNEAYLNMVVTTKDGQETTFKAYAGNTAEESLITSSDLPDAYFDGKTSSLRERLFVGKSRFIK